MLKFERLESREVPTTLADILPHYDPLIYQRPMPDVEASRVLVSTADLDGAATPGGIVDVFAAHGNGNAARIVIHDTTSGRNVADFFAFEDTFRGGVESVAVIGHELFVAPGAGGGPRVAAIDLLTMRTRSFAAAGFAESWRGGLKFTTADVEFRNTADGGVTTDPEAELLVLAASPGAGPVVAFLNPSGSAALPPIFVSDAADRREWEFVPAAAGAQNASGKMGFSVQPVGQVVDAAGRVAETRTYNWDGTRAPSDYDYDFAPIVV